LSFYYPPWENSLEPNGTNIRQFLDNLYAKFQPIEQARWSQSNIDSLFMAGSQTFINRYFNFTPGTSYQNFYFNIIQQPVNMVTGYQRQHRKSITFEPCEGADSLTTDQYSRIITHVNNQYGINEGFSKACELATVSGMVLLQPYLDYRGDDPLQGELKLKVWEYNSFLVDPYFRESNMEDAQFVWCQEYISKMEAESMFPDKLDQIRPMAGSPQRYGSFYFLPENYNMARNDLMVLSYVWYKWKVKKKRLYNPETHQFMDFAGGDEQLGMIKEQFGDVLQVIEQEVPTWKLAVILNDQLMFQGANPLGFDSCPFIPVYWYYEPHINYYDLRVRSLVRTMRDPQFLLNRRIILNHDISESSINSGYKRKVGAVANEDNLKKSGQGYDILINDGYEMTDVEKIIPNQVPPSDMELGNQLIDLIFRVSGVNMENWTLEDNKEMSGLAIMLKQGGNLLLLQKFFDQWDYALKILGEKELQIVLNNWNAAKVGMYLGEQPSPHFFSKIFAKYKVLVQEGLNTATQQQMHFRQLLDLNQMVGGIIPASYIARFAPIQGKDELAQVLDQQEKQQAAAAQHREGLETAVIDAQLKELMSKAAMNIATARERHGRNESNIGLFEERLSQITKNHAAAEKDKVESLNKLIEAIQKYGEVETLLKSSELKSVEQEMISEEDRAKAEAKRTSEGNQFVAQLLAGLPTGVQQQQQQPQQQQMPMQGMQQ
jgi:hypothetical protein